jgi:hypothetical protein
VSDIYTARSSDIAWALGHVRGRKVASILAWQPELLQVVT